MICIKQKTLISWYIRRKTGRQNTSRADNKRNLCASGLEESGDVDKILGECKYTVDRTYHTKANQQAMMETFRTYCYMDHFGRLNVVSSTQIPFHVRRILGNALDIPSSKVRVIKPRIGGGFGAKQTSVCEIYPAFVTWMTAVRQKSFTPVTNPRSAHLPVMRWRSVKSRRR